MDENVLRAALKVNKLFKIGSSFLFAAQIPDDSIGCSGSRCSNCNGAVAYCEQRCKHCGFPFVGPFGFPQLPEWAALSSEQKRTTVEDIYAHQSNRGRLGYVGLVFVPLTPEELKKVERITEVDDEIFLSVYFVSAKKIRQTLFVAPS